MNKEELRELNHLTEMIDSLKTLQETNKKDGVLAALQSISSYPSIFGKVSTSTETYKLKVSTLLNELIGEDLQRLNDFFQKIEIKKNE